MTRGSNRLACALATPAALIALVALSGCSGDSPSASDPATSARPAPIADPKPVDRATMVGLLRHAYDGITTMHLNVVTTRVGGADAVMTGASDINIPQHYLNTLLVEASRQIHTVQTGRKVYYAEGAPSGQWQYVEFNAEQAKRVLGHDVSQDLNMGADLKEFASAVVSAETLGAEDIEGVATTHYVVQLDAARLSAVGASKGAPVQLQQVDVWLSADNRPVQIAFNVDGYTSTTHITAINKPVDLWVPPKSNTVPYDELDQQQE